MRNSKLLYTLGLICFGLILNISASANQHSVLIPWLGAGWPTGNWSNIKTGDVDGDGKLEFVLVNQEWQIVCMEDLDSCLNTTTSNQKLKWSLTNEAGGVKTVVSGKVWKGWHPQSFAVWDLDDDGKCEVACTWRLPDSAVYVCVFNGETGERLARSNITFNLKHNTVGAANVGVGNFRGRTRANDISYYSDELGQIVAFGYNVGDSILTTLWEHNSWDGSGNMTGHQGHAFDVDGDGKDEFISGGVLDDDGTNIFSFYKLYKSFWTSQYNHMDNTFAADIDPSIPGIELLILPCGDDPAQPGYITDYNGNILVNPNDSNYTKVYKHLEIAALGNYRKDLPGLEMVCHIKYKVGHLFVFDKGFKLIGRIPSDEAEPSISAIDWDGDRSEDEFFLSRDTCVLVIRMNPDSVYAEDDFGYEVLHHVVKRLPNGSVGGGMGKSHPMDITGDYREELVFHSPRELIVIENTDPNPNSYPSPTEFDDYMFKFTHLGFGGTPYFPYSELGSKDTIPASAETVEKNRTCFSVSPNPFNPTTRLKYQLPDGLNKAKLEIFNIAGKRMKSQFIEGKSGTNEIHLGEYASGIYFARISSGKKVLSHLQLILTK